MINVLINTLHIPINNEIINNLYKTINKVNYSQLPTPFPTNNHKDTPQQTTNPTPNTPLTSPKITNKTSKTSEIQIQLPINPTPLPTQNPETTS